MNFTNDKGQKQINKAKTVQWELTKENGGDGIMNVNQMITQTAEEWRQEAENNGCLREAKFKCPRCGNVQSVQDFIDRGLDGNLSYQDCLGRHDESVDCDWAGYGLFGTLGLGRIVMLEGKEIEIFDFAEDSEK